MNLQNYLNSKKDIRKEILTLLSQNLPANKVNFTKLINYITEQKIRENPNEFRSFLYLISNISNNHYRLSNFFDIIDQILLFFKDEFHKHLSNSEIFNIFSSNKRLIYSLLTNQIITVTPYIAHNLSNCFINEKKQFVDKKTIQKIEEKCNIDPDSEDFLLNIKNGENENYICQLIRNDMIDDFIIFINKNNTSLNMIINTSIFESNSFLILNKPTLIEYAAFYGSIQIFKFLRLNSNVELRPILWLYAIHGRNGEIIHLIEENEIQPPDNSFEKCFEEAISCHHNEIAEYIENKYFKGDEIKENESIRTKIIVSYNFEYFPDDFIDENDFFDLCRMSHFTLAENMLKTKKIDADCKKKKNYKIDDRFYTPFLIAIRNDNTNIVELLINNAEVDVNATVTLSNWTDIEQTKNALILAISNDNVKIIQMLLNHKKIRINENTYIKRYLSDNNVYIGEYNPLIESIHPPNIEIIKLFLSHKKINVNLSCKFYKLLNINGFNFYNVNMSISPLYRAIQFGNIEVVKLFLSHPKIDVNNKYISIDGNDEYNESLLFFSIRMNQNEITKLLLQHPNIDVNLISLVQKKDREYSEEKTPLYLAVENENKGILKLLLSNNEIDVNCKCFYKNGLYSETKETTVLHKAIEIGNLKIIQLLLSSQEIDVNTKSVFKRSTKEKIEEDEVTNLNYAIINGNVEILKLLLSNKEIDINMKSKILTYTKNLVVDVKKSSIEYAVSSKNIEIFQVFFEFFIKNSNPSREFLEDIYEQAYNEQIKSIILQHI